MALSKPQTAVLTASTLLAVTAGYYYSRPNETPSQPPQEAQKKLPKLSSNPLQADRPLRRPSQHSGLRNVDLTAPPLAIENERILRFKDDACYREFLASLQARGLSLLGKSDRFRAIRVRLSSDSDLSNIEGGEMSFNYQAGVPNPPQKDAQEGALAFGSNALSWLGVQGDNSQWGAGVTVAVIDSGVNRHIALEGDITQIALTEISAGSHQLGHGTAVASIISGDHRMTPGVAPASDILSIRVSDETGSSNTFTMAEAILQAVDAGADILNISMGSYGDSQILSDAIRYAQEQGAVIVASAGNEGLSMLAYPAAYDGVISVGAVEQAGDHLDFSNSSSDLSVTAPGFGVYAAWGNEQLTAFSGTSASAPFISGAIAATMSENPQMSTQQAANLVIELSNDAGYPGSDADYGNGILDLGRIMDNGTSGIYDAAVTGQVLIQPTSPTALPEVWITIQNQGTETLINSPVGITSPSGNQQLNISSLAPGAIQTFKIPVNLPYNGELILVSSNVQIQESDKNADNNSRSDQFARE